jgi:hypothetical protein
MKNEDPFTQLDRQVARLQICRNCQFWTFQTEAHTINSSHNRFERVGTESVAFIGHCSERAAETGSFNRACLLFKFKEVGL